MSRDNDHSGQPRPWLSLKCYEHFQLLACYYRYTGYNPIHRLCSDYTQHTLVWKAAYIHGHV